MREIEFKGQRIDNKEWVYGYLYIDSLHRDTPIYYIFEQGYFKYEVIPETLGQYTGLKDKNGVEIYEEDIVEVKFVDKADNDYESDKKYNYIGTVEFSDRGYLIRNKGGFRYLYQFSSEWYEVIGNKFENKDLIKE